MRRGASAKSGDTAQRKALESGGTFGVPTERQPLVIAVFVYFRRERQEIAW